MQTQISIPRPEYPRPDFVRGDWQNLNGEWQFCEDFGQSGRERGMQKKDAPDALFDRRITVPFCRESRLSGLEHRDFCDCVWYRRTVNIPAEWTRHRRVILHIGACDWQTEVFVNGESVGVHRGGFISFSFDITGFVQTGENVLTVCAEDHLRARNQAAGKQSREYYSHGCDYTRTTGIWQTVWAESVPEAYVKHLRVFPNLQNRSVGLEFTVCGAGEITAAASYAGKEMGRVRTRVGTVPADDATGAVTANPSGDALKKIQRDRSERTAVLEMPLSELHLWEIGQGRLYDLHITFGDDEIDSYFGMREVETRDGFVWLNGKPVFQRLVLDQGFYPDGVWTAPSSEAFLADIRRSKACGFDGARLHQKIFEPRFLYECDREGYIVWGESGNWGMDIARTEAWANFIPEWVECLQRDFNHPAIIGWCPLNETQKNQDNGFLRALAAVTRAFDGTRPMIDTSGWCHVAGISDIVDNHDYTQDPVIFRERYEKMREEAAPVDEKHSHMKHPTRFVSEYGGIRWAAEDAAGWGYGNAPKSAEEFIERFRGLTEALLENAAVGGLCYTQLTDVEQELNGLYTYDRQAKFDPAVFREILQQRSVIENG